MDEIRISHVEKSYTTLSTDLVIGGAKRPSRTRKVLQDVNLTFPAGKLSVLVGRSGCGKSTLLKLLAGKEAPDAGEITLPEGWHTALLSPEPYVITWTNVRQNVAMASGVGRTPEERYEHAMEYVKLVGLEDYADLSPVELSTGMKQRLGLACWRARRRFYSWTSRLRLWIFSRARNCSIRSCSCSRSCRARFFLSRTSWTKRCCSDSRSPSCIRWERPKPLTFRTFPIRAIWRTEN